MVEKLEKKERPITREDLNQYPKTVATEEEDGWLV